MLRGIFFVWSREDSAIREDTDCVGQEPGLGLESVQQQFGYSLQTGAKIQNTHCTVLHCNSQVRLKQRAGNA